MSRAGEIFFLFPSQSVFTKPLLQLANQHEYACIGISVIKAHGLASKRVPHSGSEKPNTVPSGLPPHSTLDSNHPPLLWCVSVSRQTPAAESAKARQQSAQKETNKEHMLLLKTMEPRTHALLLKESMLIPNLLLLRLHRGPVRSLFVPQKAWHKRTQQHSAPQPGPRMCLPFFPKEPHGGCAATTSALRRSGPLAFPTPSMPKRESFLKHTWTVRPQHFVLSTLAALFLHCYTTLCTCK